MSAVSSVYGWAAIRLNEEDVVAILRNRGYDVRKIDQSESDAAVADPVKWREDHKHRPFNPAAVQGL